MPEEIVATNNNLDDILDEELLNTRKIFLFGDIDHKLAERTIKQLIYLSHKSTDDIAILIFSDGGNAEESAAIIDMMNIVKAKNIIKTICFKACSAAADILVMGSPGHRLAFQNAIIMLHKARIELPMDDEDRQKIYMEFQKEQSKVINQMIAKACKKTFDKFMKDISADMWLNAIDAKHYKIIDKIIKELSEI